MFALALLAGHVLAAANASAECAPGEADHSCFSSPMVFSPGQGSLVDIPSPQPETPTFVGKCNDSCRGNGHKGTTCNVYMVYKNSDGSKYKVWIAHNKDRYNPICISLGV